MWVLYCTSLVGLRYFEAYSLCNQIQLMNLLRQPTRVTSRHDTRSLCYLGWVYRVGGGVGGGCWRQLSAQQQLSAPSVGTCLPCTIPRTADCYHDCSWLTPDFLWLEDSNPLRNLRRVYCFETSFDLVSILVIVETRESIRAFLQKPVVWLLLLGTFIISLQIVFSPLCINWLTSL